jgi:hypothetical protein
LSRDPVDDVAHVLRSRRSRQSAVAIGFGTASLLVVAIAAFAALRSTMSTGRFYGALSPAIVVLLMAVYLGFRGFRSGTIYLYSDHLVYRSLFGNTIVKKSEIRTVGEKAMSDDTASLKVYLWAFFSPWKPTWRRLYVMLTSGRTMWLREFAAPPSSGLAQGDSYRELRVSVEEIKAWLDAEAKDVSSM